MVMCDHPVHDNLASSAVNPALMESKGLHLRPQSNELTGVRLPARETRGVCSSNRSPVRRPPLP